jgi:hypothetical protein
VLTPHAVSRLNKNPSIEDAFGKNLNPHWNHVHHQFSLNSNSNQRLNLQPPGVSHRRARGCVARLLAAEPRSTVAAKLQSRDLCSPKSEADGDVSFC